MRRYALLGERLGHSYSVPIHQAIFRILGLEADYRLLEIPRGELGARFPALCRELDGMNVTIPYKEEVMPLLDGVDDFARQVGAVNTVLCRDGVSRGYNTDVAGFMAMLERYGIPVAGHPAYVLGTGGASQAARTALKALGAASVTLVSRKPEPGELGYGELAARYSRAADYPEVALAALKAMVEATGAPCYDEFRGQERFVSGVIVRHLMLPGALENSKAVVRLLHERFGSDVRLSLMNQYTPVIARAADAGDARAAAALAASPELGRAVPDSEYEELLDFADALGVEDYFWQEGGAAEESFVPAFDFTGV